MSGATGNEFWEPISGRYCELRTNPLGVAHPDCPELADVVIHLDAFYCATCKRSGRISGAWVADVVQRGTQLRTWTLQLGERTPLSMNGQRRGPHAHARKVKEYRRLAAYLAIQAKIPPLDRIVVELHHAPRHQRRRDPMNLVATLKPVEDGIVDAGVIPDDTPQYSIPTVPIIDEPTGQPGRLYVVIREVVTIAAEGELM